MDVFRRGRVPEVAVTVRASSAGMLHAQTSLQLYLVYSGLSFAIRCNNQAIGQAMPFTSCCWQFDTSPIVVSMSSTAYLNLLIGIVSS